MGCSPPMPAVISAVSNPSRADANALAEVIDDPHLPAASGEKQNLPLGWDAVLGKTPMGWPSCSTLYSSRLERPRRNHGFRQCVHRRARESVHRWAPVRSTCVAASPRSNVANCPAVSLWKRPARRARREDGQPSRPRSGDSTLKIWWTQVLKWCRSLSGGSSQRSRCKSSSAMARTSSGIEPFRSGRNAGSSVRRACRDAVFVAHRRGDRNDRGVEPRMPRSRADPPGRQRGPRRGRCPFPGCLCKSR